jgi:hypothetical protein
MLFRTLVAATALAATALAQSFYVPTNTPTTGNANAFPFNSTDMRYQALIRATDLGGIPTLIRGFALAPSANGTVACAHLTMKMAHLAAPSLSTTFDTNLAAGSTTLLDVNNFVWPVTASVWNEVDMQTPFFFNGVDNVVVEFLVTGRTSGVSMRRDATNQRIYQGSYTGQATGTDGGLTAFKMRLITGDASTSRFGRGCVGSNTLTPDLSYSGTGQIGTTLTHNVSNGTANAPGFLSLGFYTGFPFPLDLAQFGLPGCTAYFSADATLLTILSASGVGGIGVPIPNDPSYIGIVLYSQWFLIDPLLLSGVSSSNYGRALLGN